MKIRTDFVTNSSSSNYVVSLGISYSKVGKPGVSTKTKTIWYDMDCRTDSSEDCTISLKMETEELIEKVKACKTLSELESVLIDALDLTEDFEDFTDGIDQTVTNEDLLLQLDRIPKDESFCLDRVPRMINNLYKFKSELASIENFDLIKSIIINEHYDAWGEFAPECYGDFMISIEEDESEDIIIAHDEEDDDDMDDEDDCTTFEGDIKTEIILEDGKVTRTYSY